MPAIPPGLVAPALLGALALAIVTLALGAGPTRPRRVLVLVVLLVAAVLPWLAPPDAVFLRGTLSLCVVGLLMRTTELAAVRSPVGVGARFWQCTSFFDTFLARRIAARFDVRALLAAAGYGICSAAGLAGVMALGAGRMEPGRVLLRWGAGAVFVYATIEVATAMLTLVHRAVGIDPPRLHVRPILSRSVREFWGERWNHPVHVWLRTFVFRPVARRLGARGGALAAFLVSALLHAYFVLPSVGWGLAAVMLGFFVLQGALVLAEGALRVKRWPGAMARSWTVISVLVPSPMFVEPTLRLLGI